MWSNRETRELYAHLAVPTDHQLATDIIKIVADALDDVRGEPKLWSDFERQAIRTLAISLRAHVEGLFEDFYFGPEAKRTLKWPAFALTWARSGAWTGTT